MIRVAVAARSAVARAGLERLLLADPEFSLVSSSRELSEARANADVVLAQVDGPIPEEAYEFGDEAALVLLVPHGHLENAASLLRQGVRGVLPSHSGGEQINAAVRAAAARLWVMPVDELTARSAISMAEALTPRELEVFQMMSEGLSNKQIAARLRISDHTAKFHVASIIGKLGAASRTDAVARGIRQGILTL